MAGENPASLDERHEPIGTGPSFEVSKVEEGDRRLGRYELVYEIGHGGMANVFLARARGPAGFQKWFAIKRVHDQLAKNRDFVNMFLDEARIAAAIQHPNVAHVFDLGEADGRYFLAMEYLHGEPLTSVATKCSVSMGRVPAGLAAYIVARAADGLHHAHEAKDADGQPMNLVHRDVSPHNVFVTYDGQVKLTDFGVAKAAGRITHTETGVVKGKLPYASPEQLRGDPLDRRSDIFALGVVLWEIATGRRLFRASSDAETLHRIYSGYRLSPTSLVPGFPAELERIIDRALAHDIAKRYATAAELARDLDRFLATSSQPSGSAELASTMHQLFAAQIAEKDAVLRRGRETPLDPDVPASIEIEIPEEPSRSQMRRTDSRPAEAQLTPPAGLRPGPGRALMGVALLLVAASVAAGVYFALSLPGTSQIRIDTSPGGAEVWIDGRLASGRSPVLVEDVAEGPHRVRVELAAHEPFEAEFEARGDRVELHYALTAIAPEPVPEPEPIAEVVPEPTAPEVVPEAPLPATPAPSSGRGRRPPRPPTPPVGQDTRPATLTLIARPWARVWLNGEDAGNTPIFRRSVPAGTIRVRLQREGEGPFRDLTIRAQPGENVSQNISLD